MCESVCLETPLPHRPVFRVATHVEPFTRVATRTNPHSGDALDSRDPRFLCSSTTVTRVYLTARMRG